METNLHAALNRYYGYKYFRAGQKEIIKDACQGQNVLGILPTGTGKSICYQLPARILSGTVLVVSPLISLMIDQVKKMKASGFKEVIAFNSFMHYHEKRQALEKIHNYKLIYVSPEMLQQKGFIEHLQKLTIDLFVVDEAHCISQWGHEFRPDYLKMASVIEQLSNPPVMALSATATPEVQEDIIKHLHLQKVNRHIYPMDRKNIALVVKQVADNEDKINYLAKRLTAFPGPSMIYFSSRDWTERVAHELRVRLPNLSVAYYHGGMDQEDRILIQQQFMNGQLDLICCTSAFGMGIDKPDIRLVIHFHLPSRIESFIQEIGRAGRDSEQSVSIVLIGPNDDFIPRKLIESELPDSEEVENILVNMQKLYLQDQCLPKEETLLEWLGLNEIQWRFMEFHLEKHGLLGKGEKENHSMAEWEQAAEDIKRVIIARNHYKHEKLSEILVWVHQKECRRVSLFSPFQDSVEIPEKACCDVCGFKVDEWTPAYQLKDIRKPSWEEDFKQIMLRGTIYAEKG